MPETIRKKLYIDGKETFVDPDATLNRIAAACRESVGEDILLARENGKLRELHNVPADGASISWLTFGDPEGFDTYSRSVCLMMMRAAQMAAEGKTFDIHIHYVVSEGLYCTLTGDVACEEGFLMKVLMNMRRLHEAAIPIRKTNMSTRSAIRLFKERAMQDKADLFRYRLSSRTNVYELDGYYDYFYGYMVPNTSLLHYFDIVPYGDGFVLMVPDRKRPGEIPPFRPAKQLFAARKFSEEWGESIGIATVSDLNDMIVSGRTNNLILTQEAFHEKQIAAIAQKVAEDPSKKFVMIAGPSSSGKTTFSHRLSAQLSVYGMRPHPIAVDDYFVNREDTPLDENGNYNFECLEAIDLDLFNSDMVRLLGGEEIELPTFNFKTGRREYKGSRLKLGENDILVIEGIHCLNDRLSSSLPSESKFKIYISALTQLSIDEHNRIPSTDGRLIRRIVRDARTRGNDAKATIAMWPSVRRGETEYIFPYQESADVMINSALIYELAVLKIYAEPLLFGVTEEDPAYSEARRLLKFLDYFVPVPPETIPNNSLLREFIGGSCFNV